MKSILQKHSVAGEYLCALQYSELQVLLLNAPHQKKDSQDSIDLAHTCTDNVLLAVDRGVSTVACVTERRKEGWEGQGNGAAGTKKHRNVRHPVNAHCHHRTTKAEAAPNQPPSLRPSQPELLSLLEVVVCGGLGFWGCAPVL